MGGMIANKTIKTTKRNDIMAFLDLEDLYGNIEVIVFPQTLKKYNQILNEDSIIFIRGVLNIKDLIVDHNRKFKLKDYIKSIPVINEDMIIDDAFLYLNSNYQAMAIVAGDDGEYLGIVTTTDIIEEIIGNVFDEYDKKSK